MRDFGFFVYLLASRRNGTLYCGVTNDLARRLSEHRAGRAEGFTRRYRITQLVWFETHAEIAEAILREKRIKHWNRAWKIALIEAENPGWRDLAVDLGFPRWEGFDPIPSRHPRASCHLRCHPRESGDPSPDAGHLGPRFRGDDRGRAGRAGIGERGGQPGCGDDRGAGAAGPKEKGGPMARPFPIR